VTRCAVILLVCAQRGCSAHFHFVGVAAVGGEFSVCAVVECVGAQLQCGVRSCSAHFHFVGVAAVGGEFSVCAVAGALCAGAPFVVTSLLT